MSPKPKRTNPAPESVEENTTSIGSARRTNNTSKTPKKIRSRVPRGHWKNSFSSSVSGSLARQIAHNLDGTPNEAINKLYQSLGRRFDADDVVAALSIDLLLADFWRLSEATKYEKKLIDDPSYLFHPQNSMPTLTRYVGSARRNLDNALKMLCDLEEEAAEAEAFESEFDKADPETSSPSSPEASRATEKSEEPASQVKAARPANESPSSAPPVNDAAPQGGEVQPDAKESAPETPDALQAPPAETDAVSTPTAASKAAEAVDVAVQATEGDVSKAA